MSSSVPASLSLSWNLSTHPPSNRPTQPSIPSTHYTYLRWRIIIISLPYWTSWWLLEGRNYLLILLSPSLTHSKSLVKVCSNNRLIDPVWMLKIIDINKQEAHLNINRFHSLLNVNWAPAACEALLTENIRERVYGHHPTSQVGASHRRAGSRGPR